MNNMTQNKYDFPTPNDKNRYNLSKEEFTKILEYVFDRGYEYACNVHNIKKDNITINKKKEIN